MVGRICGHFIGYTQFFKYILLFQVRTETYNKILHNENLSSKHNGYLSSKQNEYYNSRHNECLSFLLCHRFKLQCPTSHIVVRGIRQGNESSRLDN